MPECLFCRIVQGELPAAVVAEDDQTLAFRDINPQAPTHVLVIPKTHIANAHELAAEHAGAVMAVLALAQRVAEEEGLVPEGSSPAAPGGYRLVFNVGRDAGNTVPHLHLHVLGGRSLAWPPG